MALMLGGHLYLVSFYPKLSRCLSGSSCPAPVQTSRAEADETTPVAHTRTCVTQLSGQCSTETSNSAK